MKISAQRVILCFYAISFHVTMLHVRCDWLVKCGNCRCKWNSGKKTADCKNMTMNIIPTYLSSELQVLDLSYNRIKMIGEHGFLSANLQNLHKLFMKNCSVEEVHPNGLEGLEILIELDLSNNYIRTLSENIFVSLVKVRSVILNNNFIEYLQDGLFRNLKYLHKIELKDNRISSVELNVFVNLPFLSQIFLSGNRLSSLQKDTFAKLAKLTSLSLEANPWNCTCDLQEFRDFTLKRNLYTPPTSCFNPPHLRGMLWTDNQPEAFACKPRIIYPSRGASINTSKENVTLICRVHASANTLIVWDYNKQIFGNHNQPPRINIQLMKEEKDKETEDEVARDIFISRLTIINAEKSDEGTYTCTAENSGGRDEVQMNLLVQKHNHQTLIFQNNLVIIICLMVLGLLSASILLAMITCCVYKRFKSINQTTTEDQQHQKRNFTGVNVVNSVNEAFHQTNDSSYVEIKRMKVSSTNSLGVGSINNFTDLTGSKTFYTETSNPDAITPQTQPNCSTIPGHHKSDHTLEYQPDLLPYIPQSISFNNSSLYSYSLNQSIPYQNNQHLAQELNGRDHHERSYHDDHPIDDFRYGNATLRRSKYGLAQHPQYLHYNAITLPSSKPTNTSTETTTTTIGASTSSMITAPSSVIMSRRYEGSSELDDIHNLPRQSIVRTSPSLNFLSNYYQRRELL